MLVIYDVLTFAARCQNAKKKLLQFRNICLRFNAFFSLSALSVGILRFEELAQSLDVLMLVCKSKLP
jgi:hypothetical protein